MKLTRYPAIKAVTSIVVVKPEVPASVHVELTEAQAALIGCLLANVNGRTLMQLGFPMNSSQMWGWDPDKHHITCDGKTDPYLDILYTSEPM